MLAYSLTAPRPQGAEALKHPPWTLRVTGPCTGSPDSCLSVEPDRLRRKDLAVWSRLRL